MKSCVEDVASENLIINMLSMEFFDGLISF